MNSAKKKQRSRCLRTLLVIAALAATPAVANVVYFTWTGADQNSPDWTEAANWTTTSQLDYPGQLIDGQPPAEFHHATIDDISNRSLVRLDRDITIGHLIIGDGHTIQLDENLDLDDHNSTLDAGLELAGTVTIQEDDASESTHLRCLYISVNSDDRTEIIMASDSDDDVCTLYTDNHG